MLRRHSRRASCGRGPRLARRPRTARSASFIEEGEVLGRLPFSAASARNLLTTRLSVLRNNVHVGPRVMSSARPVTQDGGVTGNRGRRGDDPAQKTTRTEGRGIDEQHSAGTPTA